MDDPIYEDDFPGHTTGSVASLSQDEGGDEEEAGQLLAMIWLPPPPGGKKWEGYRVERKELKAEVSVRPRLGF